MSGLENGEVHEILVPRWDKSDPDFDIPRALLNTLGFLRSEPIRAVAVKGSGPVHARAIGEGAIVEIYRDAIVVASPFAARDRGFFNKFGLACSILGFVGMAVFSYLTISMMAHSIWEAFDIFGLLFLVCAAGLFLLATIWFYRMLGLPSDWPILFNRKTRQVTYFKVNFPSLFRFNRQVPVEMVTRPWDEAKLRTYRSTLFFGKTFRIVHQMALLWGDPLKPEVLKDVVLIGDPDIVDDGWNLALWEHIRQYMEEGGPPLRHGETLRKPLNPKPPLQFPRDIRDAAGGGPLSVHEVDPLVHSTPR